MALANVRHITYPLFGGNNFGGHKGQTYDQIVALLKSAIPSYSELSSKGLPMWGALQNMVEIKPNAANYSMDMLRSAVRIDVGTNNAPSFDAQGKATYAALGNFSLQEVRLYKAIDSYMVAPAWNAYNFSQDGVTTTTIPTTAAKNANSLVYSSNVDVDVATGNGYSLVGNIYTGETDIAMGGSYGDDNHLNRTAIVVVGYYTPDDAATENTTTLSYYRLDFTSGSSKTLFPALLRNHDYQFVITSVDGPGSPDEPTAISKFNTDMTASIFDWTDADVKGSVFEGQDYLSVSEKEFTLSHWPKADTRINVNTSIDAGWSATIITPNASWIQLYDLTQNPAVPAATVTGASGDDIRFSVDDNPANPPTRTATIRVTAGGMSIDVIVTQGQEDSDFMLQLSASNMTFPGRKWDEATQTWVKPDPQSLRITYGPSNKDYEISSIAYEGEGLVGLDLPASSNAAAFTIQPDMIDETNASVVANPFYRRSSKVKVTAYNADNSQSMSRTVILQQQYYSLSVTGYAINTPIPDYYMLGKSYQFTVRANAPWQFNVTGDTSIFQNAPSANSKTGVTTNAGEKLTFSIKSNATPGAEAVITISNADNLFPPQSFTVMAMQDNPNSYIVTPGESITFPVRKAYDVWKADDILQTDISTLGGAESAEMLWQDAQGLISSVTLNGTGINATITVQTTGTTVKTAGGGNAVIAYSIGGTIYWSWHLWVTDYNPDNGGQTYNYGGYTFMDRNLGATTNVLPSGTTDALCESFGLYYQGNRKDPWLGPVNARRNLNPPIERFQYIYDMDGNDIRSAIDATTAPEPFTSSLPGSINHPMRYYRSSYGSGDWQIGFAATNDIPLRKNDLWLHYYRYKGAYDPCPKGWRIQSSVNLDVTSMIGEHSVSGPGVDMPGLGSFPYSSYMNEKYEVNQSQLNPSNDAQYIVLLYNIGSLTMTSIPSLYRFFPTGEPTLNYSSSQGVAAPLRCIKE
jgi:hypothetical protein